MPAKPITDEIEKINGISNDMVQGYPTIEKVLPKFLAFVDSTVLVAHNTDFDVNFLKYHINKHLKQEFKNPSICTLRIAQKFLPGLPNHKLHTLAEYFKVPTPLLHRALADAEITYQIWLKMLEGLNKNKITTLKDLAKAL